ncbi:MAG: PepSY domain-containing protein [Sphingobacteriales bacterium]|nr:PepSY domain-containing protein [Sphingobacteriales bacterium]
MKKTSFLRVFAFLGIVSLVVWGCGGWLSKKKAQQQTLVDATLPKAKSESISIYQMPIDSLIKTKSIEHNYTSYTFDTSKCKYFPDFTPENIFTLPKYKALFGWTDDYTIEPTEEYKNSPRLMYKNVPYQGSSCSYSAVEGRIRNAKGLKFIPINEPSEIKISMDEAIKIALEQEYLTRKGQIRKRLIDSLGYVPEKYREMLTDPPMSDNEKKIYSTNAKFIWEKKIPNPADSIYHPKGELLYIYSGNKSARLAYEFYIYAIKGLWHMYIDPLTGEVIGMHQLTNILLVNP